MLTSVKYQNVNFYKKDYVYFFIRYPSTKQIVDKSIKGKRRVKKLLKSKNYKN